MLQDYLSRFEERVQRLVEGGFARLFAEQLHPREVIIQLARAMEDHVREEPGGRSLAPDIYIVRLAPEDHESVLAGDIGFSEALGEELAEMARLAGLSFANTPEVRLLADRSVEPGQVTVNARHALPMIGATEKMQRAALGEMELQNLPQAMLILNGDHPITLDRPVLNLGRQRDNHIILDSPRVSRHHAQIRLRFGRYVLFDLGSSAGTTVNGQPVREAVLQSGDVIKLADSGMIYVEGVSLDEPADEGGESTKPYSPSREETG